MYKNTFTENYRLSVMSDVHVRMFIFINELTLILGVSALCLVVHYGVEFSVSGTDTVGFRSL